MLLNLFSSRPDHPLAEAKELRRVIGELPLDHPYKAVDEVHGWFESLLVATDFRADLLFGVARQLDEAAQPFLRRLARDCLQVQGVLQALPPACAAPCSPAQKAQWPHEKTAVDCGRWHWRNGRGTGRLARRLGGAPVRTRCGFQRSGGGRTAGP